MSSSSDRMHRLSMVYALCGLLFAGIAAGLIVATARPISRVVVVDFSLEGIEQITAVGWVRGSRRLMEATNEIVPAEIAPSSLAVTQRPTASPTPSPTITSSTPLPSPASPTVSPPAEPSATPPTVTVLDGDNSPAETVSTSDGDGSTTIQSVAAAMVGLSSAIIVCALGLYVSDLRERRRHAKWAAERNQQDIVDDHSSQKSAFRSRVGGESQTSAGSMHGSNAESSYWVHARLESAKSTELVEYEGGGRGNPQNMLPPMLADEARPEDANHTLALTRIEQDDASISRVSTLTMSLKEGGYSYGCTDIEDKLSRYAIESSSNVTELNDAHRVSGDTKLTSLVKGGMEEDTADASVCSSLTNGSQSTAQLLGEDCLDIKIQTPEATPFASLEVSPDTPHVEEDVVMKSDDEDDDDFTIDSHEASKENELAQLEQLLAGIPFDELSQGTPAPKDNDDEEKADSIQAPDDTMKEAYVRNVSFVPYAMEGKISLGLELTDASTEDGFPCVSEIDLKGPLAHQVFVGDAILAVNEKDTSGLSAQEVTKLFVGANTHADGREGKTIKLTVMTSSEQATEDESFSDDDDDSIDLASATEV